MRPRDPAGRSRRTVAGLRDRSRGAIAGLTAAALLAGMATVSGPGTGPTAAADPACVNGWREVPTPASVFLSTPFDIVTRNGSEAWILGGTNTGVLALRWSGGAWKQAAARTSGHRGLVGGVADGKDRVLAVGYYRPHEGEGTGSLEPISGRVVVNTWRSRAVPDLPGPRSTLTDVVALGGGKALAVGTRLQGGKLRATALGWDGRRWSRQEPPGGTGSGLLATARAGSGAVWAVGWREARPGKPRPYILRRAGKGWKSYAPAALPAGSAVLTDVYFRAGADGYAVGYLAPTGSDQHQAVLMHWDGRSWKRLGLPWAAEFAAVPRSVSVGRDGTIWIAGTKPAIAEREPRGFIAHGRGDVWRVDSLGTTDDIRSEVMAVAATDQGAVAAASVGASLLALKTCGENVTSARKPAAKGGARPLTKRRLQVSQLARRRASQLRDANYVHEHHDPGADIGAADALAPGTWSIAGDEGATWSLAAAPIAHPAFVVRDMAAASGLAQTTKTYDGFAADLDGNGFSDVFYSRHGAILPRLAMNLGGSFVNAPTTAFSSVDRHGCDDGDLDGDGQQDIICAVGGSRGKAIARHELSLKPFLPDGRLAMDVLGASDPLGRGRQVGVLRLNDDRFPEVFLTNAPDRDDGFPGYNRFYRNVGGRLVPAPGVGLDSSHGAECVEASDVDGDGDDDLVYCTQYGFAGRPAGLRFMRNENGRLVDRTETRKIRPMGDIDVVFADVTGDGRKDLIQLAPNRLRVSRWTKKGYGRIFEARITHAWAVAAGDASGDGRADIYVVRGTDRQNKPDRLLVSRANGAQYASVRIPTTGKGTADDVFALDYDNNGLTDFVVLNGRTRAGPVQLLASFPRP